MKRKIIILILVFWIIPISSIAGVKPKGAPCPIKYVRNISDKMITILNTTKGTLSLNQIKQIREQLHGFIDCEKLSELLLGSFYNDLLPEQKKEFQEELSKHISTNYLLKVNRSRDDQGQIEIIYPKKVPYKTTKRNGKAEELCMVKICIKKGDSSHTEIKLYGTLKNNGWPAYNIAVDDVKMLGNFRSQFKSYIRKGKTPAQIIAIVREKVTKLEKDIQKEFM
jgi:ABC-type transporter MlaC component